MRNVAIAILAIGLISTCSCSSGRNADWKKTYPVTGQVYVDGSPAEGVAVAFDPVGGMDKAKPTITSAITDSAGKFSASTYKQGDGAPAGEYILTFQWGQLNTLSMAYEGDKLNGRYADPKTSKFKVKVEAQEKEDQPIDMGRIDLTTK